MNPEGIDTSALLTMLGLIAAVWAIVPNTARLTFRLSLNKLDWFLIWSVLLVVHAFFFEPVLSALGVPTLGTWKWGFDKSATQYSLFLLLAGYVYWRSRKTKLTRRNLGLFDELSTSLLHGRKFEELAELLQLHLEPALNLATPEGIRSRLADAIRPRRPEMQLTFNEDRTITILPDEPTNWLAQHWLSARQRLADLVGPSQKVQRQAVSIVKRLLSSRGLVTHLAISRPYFCLQVIARVKVLVESFQDDFFSALLADEASIFYSEIKNNDNWSGTGRRLALPEENRLMRFYCADVTVAGRLGVYRSVGEAVLARIDTDVMLEKKLNERLLTFQDVGKHHDPVYAGLMFFRIMVLEGLHQRVTDHLWLHYVTFFASHLVDRARELRSEDDRREFATPLGYLLYEIVDATSVWIAEAGVLTAPGDELERAQQDGDHAFISFEAAETIGRVIHPIFMSSCVSWGLKKQLLTVALSTLKELETFVHLAPLAEVMRASLIQPYHLPERDEYLSTLRRAFNAQDHVLRMQLNVFKQQLDAALSHHE